MSLSPETTKQLYKNRINDSIPSYRTDRSSSIIHRITEPQGYHQDEERKQVPNQERSSYSEKVLSFTARVNASTETFEKDEEEVQELLKTVSFPKEINPDESATKELKEFSRKLNPKLRKKYNLPPNLICVEFLGNGSYGKVYKVFDKNSRCFLAAKEPKDPKSDPLHNTSAYREYMAHLELIKPPTNPKLLHVVQVYEPQRKFCVLMEYGHGSLADFCRFRKEKGRPWTDEELVELYYQLVEQIDELKKMKICHRDIKPDNIIYSSQEFFKLTDFGFAEQVPSVDVEQNLIIAGTPGYCHPKIEEAEASGKLTCRIVPYKADLYSIKKTINKIMEDSQRQETIDDLLIKTLRPCKKILDEKELDQYKIFLFEEFNQKAISFDEKREKLQIFTEYCAPADISKWLEEKLKNPKDDDEERLANFFLGHVRDSDGDHDAAMEHFKKCEELSIRGQKNDKLTASLYNRLGVTKCHLFEWKSCKDYHSTGLDLKIKLFGKFSPEVAEECLCLAFAEFILGNRDIVLNLVKDSLAIYQEKPELVSNLTVNMLSFLVTGLGSYEEAVDINQKLLDSTTQSRGERHPSVAFILMCLGAANHRLGKTESALTSFEKSLKIHQETVKPDHQHMTYFWFHCGEAFKESGDHEKAMTYFQQSLELLNSKYKEKPIRFAVLIFIAELWIQRDEKAEEAKEYLDECERNLQKIEHSDYYYVGVFWRALGLLHQKKGNNHLALENYQKSIQCFQKLSPENIWIASSLIQIGALHLKGKSYQDAETNLLQAHFIFSQKNIQKHHLFVMCSFQLGQLYSAQEDYERARKYFTQARNARTDLTSSGYPKLYPTTQDIQSELDKINSTLTEGNMNADEMAYQISSG